MLVRFKTKEDNGLEERILSPTNVRVEGVRHVISADIHIDWNSKDSVKPVTATMEIMLGGIDLSAEGEMFTTIEGKRYRLIEVEQ